MIISEPLYKLIGEKIKAARESAKMSQKELAEKIGFETATALSLIETGDRKISIEVLQKIAEILHFDLNYFLGKEEKKTVNIKVALRSEKNLSSSDKQQILEFVEFIKNKRKDGGNK
jgi:transcriptional regulator with XRE-family HTH domain